jgi:hypothetical protein
MRAHVIKFLIGAFGTFLIFEFRDVPALPGLSHFSHWLALVIFMASGGFSTVICQIGDEAPFRSFYFGLTWPALISLVTR